MGHAEVPGGESGCTVILGPFRGRARVHGLGSGTRELATLDPAHRAPQAHALLLTGGSAFGLAAADGVMAELAAEGIGLSTPGGPVPIVPGAVIYDLAPERERPGVEEGRRATRGALVARREGRCTGIEPADHGSSGRSPRRGAGLGATVGKLLGPEAAMPGGLGEGSAQVAGGWVGALAVVNALGDVLDETGQVVAGARPDPGPPPRRALDLWAGTPVPRAGENTTLAVVATDVPLSDADLMRVLQVAGTALPRRIDPVFTPFDGDVVFALCTSGVAEAASLPRDLPPALLLALAVAARDALERAILRAVGWEPARGPSVGSTPLAPPAPFLPPAPPSP